jgi:hypothetical protein
MLTSILATDYCFPVRIRREIFIPFRPHQLGSDQN